MGGRVLYSSTLLDQGFLAKMEMEGEGGFCSHQLFWIRDF